MTTVKVREVLPSVTLSYLLPFKALKTATFLLMVASIHPSLGDEDSSMMFDVSFTANTWLFKHCDFDSESPRVHLCVPSGRWLWADLHHQARVTWRWHCDGQLQLCQSQWQSCHCQLPSWTSRILWNSPSSGGQRLFFCLCVSFYRHVYQENFVTIRARPDTLSNVNILEARRQEQTFTPPATPAPVQFIDNPAPLFKNIQFQDISAQPEETEPDLVNVVVEQITPVVSDVVFTESTLARSGPIDSSDLVAQIIAQLTPLIQETVSTTLTSRAQSRQVSASNLPLVFDSNVQNWIPSTSFVQAK